MVDNPSTTDFARLDEDLRAVCARHGLAPGHGEEVHGWAAVIGVSGHFPDGRGYARTYCLNQPGLAPCDVERLFMEGKSMTELELSPRPAG